MQHNKHMLVGDTRPKRRPGKKLQSAGSSFDSQMEDFIPEAPLV
jgi:hypothetical protein